ncbi:MAG: tetratricopeptide repeat protein [Planctomycetota bacterium]
MRTTLLALALLLVPALVRADEQARKQALALNEVAVRAYGEGRYEDALSGFRQAYNLEPRDPTILRNLAFCLIRLGDGLLLAGEPARALRDYGEAGRLLPDDWVPRFREGLALYRAQREREAATLLERALSGPNAGRVDGWELLALARYRLGENAEAIRAWEKAIELDPKNERLAKDLARARREEKVEGQLFLDQSTPHFAIKYDGARETALGKRVGQLLEEAYQVVGAQLGRYPTHELSVVIYPSKSFRALTGSHAWVAALYDGKIRIPGGGLATAPLAEQRRVLRHEYAHAVIHELGGARVPPWLHEGLAQLAEGRTRADARQALSGQPLPDLAALSRPFAQVQDAAAARVLYAAACDWVCALEARGGQGSLAALLERLGKGETLDAACRGLFSASPAELHAAWAAR